MSGSKTGREPTGAAGEDTALRGLTYEDRRRLSMDAWEPSLLRHMLRALGRDRQAHAEPGSKQASSEPLE